MNHHTIIPIRIPIESDSKEGIKKNIAELETHQQNLESEADELIAYAGTN